ncbi:hypothetical protein BXT86_02280 [candidate division WOR-3 bacterium 4484_100]|uniref:DUF5668 domain-containing protein n=1 Tax=candidate division WOR-3 bacterium 4484_100 TaxID=1936077 RepID=A0A1V4QHL4_UNCW3|nr:MAG: hypothetical protein BXT86_02280 [candidate division WOR-3 bacterium 4484_100]
MTIWISIFIFVGLFIWLSNLHILSLGRDWPLILIFLGAISLFTTLKKGKKYKIISELEKGRISAQEAEEKLRNLS